jgi:hypothetical protein
MRPCQFALLDKGRGRIVALTDEQADALLKAAVADKDPYCWLFIAFGLNTTMRHGEILAHGSTNWISIEIAFSYRARRPGRASNRLAPS